MKILYWCGKHIQFKFKTINFVWSRNSIQTVFFSNYNYCLTVFFTDVFMWILTNLKYLALNGALFLNFNHLNNLFSSAIIVWRYTLYLINISSFFRQRKTDGRFCINKKACFGQFIYFKILYKKHVLF